MLLLHQILLFCRLGLEEPIILSLRPFALVITAFWSVSAPGIFSSYESSVTQKQDSFFPPQPAPVHWL